MSSVSHALTVLGCSGDHDGVVTAHELLTACSDTEVRTALQWNFPDAKLEDLKLKKIRDDKSGSLGGEFWGEIS